MFRKQKVKGENYFIIPSNAVAPLLKSSRYHHQHLGAQPRQPSQPKARRGALGLRRPVEFFSPSTLWNWTWCWGHVTLAISSLHLFSLAIALSLHGFVPKLLGTPSPLCSTYTRLFSAHIYKSSRPPRHVSNELEN